MKRGTRTFVTGGQITRNYLKSLNGAVRKAAEGDPGELAEPLQRTVLIVDDDSDMRFALSCMLTRFEWGVCDVASPLQSRLAYGRADVVLSDWDMPAGGGELVLAESPIPVVILSGRSPSELPPGTHSLLKPASGEQIDAALRAAIKGIK